MTGLYFSGTGNSRHAVEEFMRHTGPAAEAFSIETPGLDALLASEDTIVLGYPTCFSNMPLIVRDFIKSNPALFAGKRVFLISTMGLWSGDGTGCAARLLRRTGTEIVGGLQLKMPDSIGDERMLKRPLEVNRALVRRADEKIARAASMMIAGRPSREGLSLWAHLAGLFGQRLWFYGKSTSYKDKPTIDIAKCTVCGLCVRSCPMGNLEKRDGGIAHGARCTMCYRCVNQCPAGALTILGKRIYEQPLFEKYR
jgi:ferredoxin/flavodoxin